MSNSKARAIELDAINLSTTQVMAIIDNYIQEKGISYSALQKELNIPATTISQMKHHNTRSYKLWKWADSHREYLACNSSHSSIAVANCNSAASIDGMVEELFQKFYHIPKEKRKLFIQLCIGIADTLIKNNTLEEGNN